MMETTGLQRNSARTQPASSGRGTNGIRLLKAPRRAKSLWDHARADFCNFKKSEGLCCRCQRYPHESDGDCNRNADSPTVFMQTRPGLERMVEKMDCQTTICHEWPGDFGEKLAAFQCYVIKLHGGHGSDLSQCGNTGETCVYFEMLMEHTVDEGGARKTTGKTSGYDE